MAVDRYIDLHIHSNNSDGTFTPKQLVDIAEKNNVGILSITDHDSISGLEEFKCSIPYDVIGVKGIEFSSFIMDNNEKIKLHILGYGFDEDNYLFQLLVNEMREKRKVKHLELLKKLREKIKNLPEENIQKLNIDRYCWFDREVINCLEQAEYSKEIIDELRNYYKINRFSYGSEYDLDVKRVIEAIHLAGGYVVFAHPMAYKFSNDKDMVLRIINNLIYMEIDGVEIYQSDCLCDDSIWLNRIVSDNNLLYSVGSDFHRTINSDGRQIGLGINNNLCITQTSLINEIIKSKKYFRKVK